MRQRDRLSLREEYERREAEERAERERREAPIREAQALFADNYRKLAEVYRERLLGKVVDPDPIAVDPVTVGMKITKSQSDDFNRSEFEKYRKGHPEMEPVWLAGDGLLLNRFGEYFTINGLWIVTASMLSELVERYRAAGLLPDPPEPEPAPEPEPEPKPMKTSEVYEGRDPDTGLPRSYTKRQVYLMSSEQYARCFGKIGTVAELLSAMREQR